MQFRVYVFDILNPYEITNEGAIPAVREVSKNKWKTKRQQVEPETVMAAYITTATTNCVDLKMASPVSCFIEFNLNNSLFFKGRAVRLYGIKGKRKYRITWRSRLGNL